MFMLVAASSGSAVTANRQWFAVTALAILLDGP